MRVCACPEPSKNREMSKCTKWTVAVWRACFRGVLARTLLEQKQKHWFLQRPRAIWRAPVGTVEQLYKAME